MTALQEAKLTLVADADGDGSNEAGIFRMIGGPDAEISSGVRTGYLVGGRGSTLIAVISSIAGDGENKRKGVHLDLGGGVRFVEVAFRGWEGAKDTQGNDVQWGNDPNPSNTQASATGQDPLSQMNTLERYLTVGEFDSRNPAKLEYGEYNDTNGKYSSVDVAIEGPRFTRRADEGTSFTGSITFLSTLDLGEVLHTGVQEDG